MSGNRGLSMLAILFALLALSALGAITAVITKSAVLSSVDSGPAFDRFYVAQSGLEWFSQATDGYTTANKADYVALDGASIRIKGANGPLFKLTVQYLDTDNDPLTENSVTVTSTGYSNTSSLADGETTLVMEVIVPPGSSGVLFADEYDQPDLTKFDTSYVFGSTTSAHGDIVPMITAGNLSGGDVFGLFTHSSEVGGVPGALRAGGVDEVRLFITAERCLKWATEAGAPCDYPECENRFGCQARNGLDVPLDSGLYHNYFIKIRARLITGGGFGVYFRMTHLNDDDPYRVDFGKLSAHIWQYDTGLGYIAPCQSSTALLGNDGKGMLTTRKIKDGSEVCPVECGVFTSQTAGVYPFFCPENKTGLPALDGWRWRNLNWLSSWRTIYIYVYRDRANVYVEREELIPPVGPEHVASIKLDDIGGLLPTGGVGLRVWSGALVEVDYLEVYPNDDDKDPSTFTGS